MKKTIEFPKFFFYLYIALALCIFVGTFFSSKVVGTIYFITLIISIVYYFLDKKYGNKLSNYKQNFLMFDIINFFAIISIIFYESGKHTSIIITFLSLIIILSVMSLIFDIFFVKNENFVSLETVFIDASVLGIMICILTYLFDVSDLWYAIIAFALELLSLVLKIAFNYKNVKLRQAKLKIEEEKEDKETEAIENIIQEPSGDDNTEGDL